MEASQLLVPVLVAFLGALGAFAVIIGFRG